MKAMADHEVYPLTPEQLAAWRKSAEPSDRELGGGRAAKPATIPRRFSTI